MRFALEKIDMYKKQEAALGSYAIGTIGPAGRIESGEITEKRIANTIELVKSRKHYTQAPNWKELQARCMDGRPPVSIDVKLGVSMPGGSLTAVVSDLLTLQSYEFTNGAPLKNSAECAKNTLMKLKEKGFKLGDHVDCGAAIKMSNIFQYIEDKSDGLADVMAQFGIERNEAAHNFITAQAKNLMKNLEFSSGADLMDEIKAVSGADKSVVELEGEHREVVAALNEEYSTIFDQAAFYEENGKDCQVFTIDVWAFPEYAKALSENKGEEELRFYAMSYYSFAAACVLGDESLKVIKV